MFYDRELTLFHAPNTRSSAVLVLLEELGVPHRLQVLDMQRDEQRQPDYLAINPMGKVPAIRHGDALVTEQVAIFLYLADLFPQTELAPAINDPLRGPYLRWMIFYASCFEPAVVDRALQRDAGRQAMSPYGDFDTMLATLLSQLVPGPWLLGERFSAADLLWGTALTWTTMFRLVPERPDISAYLERLAARPAVARARARDAALAAGQEQAAPPT